MSIQESGEMYLETIYILSKKTKLGPIQLIAIAGIIGVVAQLGI